jgi:hypothetical protein
LFLELHVLPASALGRADYLWLLLDWLPVPFMLLGLSLMAAAIGVDAAFSGTSTVVALIGLPFGVVGCSLCACGGALSNLMSLSRDLTLLACHIGNTLSPYLVGAVVMYHARRHVRVPEV